MAKDLLETKPALDVRRFVERGYWVANARFQWRWRGRNEVLISFHLREDMCLVASYWAKDSAGPPRFVQQKISTSTYPARFDGTRHCLHCPSCSKRVFRLYLHERRFLCRCCHGLSYRSQRLDEIDRVALAMAKLRERLGAPPDISSEIPKRPKGMWRKTYRHLLSRLLSLEQRYCDLLEPTLASAVRLFGI